MSRQPEAIFRYINLLLSTEMQRFDDARLLADTTLKLDPKNGQIQSLVEKLKNLKP